MIKPVNPKDSNKINIFRWKYEVWFHVLKAQLTTDQKNFNVKCTFSEKTWFGIRYYFCQMSTNVLEWMWKYFIRIVFRKQNSLTELYAKCMEFTAFLPAAHSILIMALCSICQISLNASLSIHFAVRVWDQRQLNPHLIKHPHSCVLNST